MKKKLLATLMLVSAQIKAQDFWEEVPAPDSINTTFLPINQNDIIIAAETSLLIYRNAGETWNVDLVGNNGLARCRFIEKKDNVFYAILGGDLYIKNSIVSVWSFIASSFNQAICMSIMNDSVFFQGHWFGIDKTSDGGYTWQNVFTPGYNECVEAIIQHPNGYLFCGTYSIDQNDVSGVYRSIDTGATWTQTSLKCHMPMALATDSEGNLYAGSWGHWHSGVGGVYKSTDLGVTWDTLKLGIGVRSIVITPGDTIFVGHRGGYPVNR